MRKKSDDYSRDKYYAHYPLRSPSYLVARIAGREIERAASMYFNGKLIDIGCGEKWKQDLIGRYVDSYTGLDHEDTQHDKSNVDMFGTVYHIPVEGETFDSAICTAVLEHVEEPSEAIAECYRVLKKNGFAIYTAPFSWRLHEEPRDFFRYTKYGLKHLFEKNGFNIVEIKPLSGYWVTAAAHWAYYLRRFKKRGILNPLRWLVNPLTVCAHVWAGLLTKFDHSEEFTWMYLVIVRK